jgi:hypothetical protein
VAELLRLRAQVLREPTASSPGGQWLGILAALGAGAFGAFS